jgi:large subunit ribosomal protein L21
MGSVTSQPSFPLVKMGRLCDFPRLFSEIPMAFAIIKTGGRQYRVSEGDIIDVDFLDAEPGKEGLFAEVLFHADGSNLTHGTPLIEGATVEGEIIEQRKDKKVIAFKYRRRKGYHRTVGHRRKLTRVKITGISLSGKSSKPKKAAKSDS